MASYKELLAQREALENAIAQARKTELSEAISKVRAVVAEFNLSPEDVFVKVRVSHNPVAPKYRDPATGQTWTGRGKAPKWIDGKNRDVFAIPADNKTGQLPL